mgnify:CR=1 FL=1
MTEPTTPTLEDAIALAVRAHRGQVDKGGMPYILHPLGVMLRMRTEIEMLVAVLHDVIEDTEYTIDTLRREGYPEEVLVPLDHVTRREGESYEAFTRRAGEDPVARCVKIADLEDNMDVRRIAELTDKDLERMRRYQRAWRMLTAER